MSRKKMGNCRWLPAVDPHWCFELLQSVSTKLIPPVPRQALLRWWIRGEADQQFHNHTNDIHTANGPCFCGCGAGQYRPHGMNGHLVAACHLDRTDGANTPLWVHTAPKEVLQFVGQRLQLEEQDPRATRACKESRIQPETCPACWFCQQGDNSVEHWVSFCPVANTALSVTLGRITTPSDWFPEKGQHNAVDHLLIVTHTVHTLRQHLLAANAFAPPRERGTPIRHVEALDIIATIGAEVWRALPLTLTGKQTNPWASAMTITECAETVIQGVSTRAAPQLSGVPDSRKKARRI